MIQLSIIFELYPTLTSSPHQKKRPQGDDQIITRLERSVLHLKVFASHLYIMFLFDLSKRWYLFNIIIIINIQKNNATNHLFYKKKETATKKKEVHPRERGR
jgi:hypothetical protein